MDDHPPTTNRDEPARGGPSSSAPMHITMSTVRGLITREALRSSKPVPLFKLLRDRVVKHETLPPQFAPSPTQLRELLSALAEFATNHYLRAMADDERYTSVIQKWLRMFVKDPAEWEPAIAPLFKVGFTYMLKSKTY